MLYIQKNPNPQTLIAKVYTEDRPEDYELSTEEEADAWVAEQLANGWQPEPIVVIEPSPTELLKARISDMRWQRETAGVTIGTQPVSTLREEMPVWQGMLLDITLQPGVRSEYEYKPRNGANVVLTPQQVQRCYQCFAWYVSECFSTERYLCGLIDAGTPLEQVEAMLNTVWPQTQFDWVAPE